VAAGASLGAGPTTSYHTGRLPATGGPEVECLGVELCEPCLHPQQLTRPGIIKDLIHRDDRLGAKLRDGVEPLRVRGVEYEPGGDVAVHPATPAGHGPLLRSRCFWTLPTAVRGSSSTNSTTSGT